MIEKCSQKQMICYIALILGLSLCVFIIEEYIEEQNYEKNLHIINSPNYNLYVESGLNGSRKIQEKKNIILSKKILPKEKLSLLCKEKKNLETIQECISCKEEDKYDNNTNIKEICTENKYYTKYECKNESKLILQGCKITTKNEKKSFYIFFIISLISSMVFSYLSINRRHQINTATYTKINNLVG
uniref:Jumping translocation breakpoint protein n=1 Tax=Strongyloides stercoralis TaxID=6248 RepID=A0A0K0ENZ9_STRER